MIKDKILQGLLCFIFCYQLAHGVVVIDKPDFHEPNLPLDSDGRERFLLPNECHPQIMKSWNASNMLELRDYASEFFERCTPYLYHRHYLNAFLHFSQTDQAMKNHPQVKPVTFELDNGIKLQGYLSLHEDERPRPLVIIQCGIFCGGSSSETKRNYREMVAEHSQFHVIALAGNTSVDYATDNRVMSIGGLDEGAAIYRLAKEIKSGDLSFSKKISSIHVLGVSLGGHAALYSSLYSSLNPLPDGQKVINSSMAICPVVDTTKSFYNLLVSYPNDLIYPVLIKSTLKAIKDDVPEAQNFMNRFSELKKDGNQFTKELIRLVTVSYNRTGRVSYKGLRPFEDLVMNDEQDHFAVHDFVKYQDLVSIPTFLISAEDDFIVRSSDNSLRVKESETISHLYLKRGTHCAFAFANGFAQFSGLIRTFLNMNIGPEERIPEFTLDLTAYYNKEQMINFLSKHGIGGFKSHFWEVGESKTVLHLAHPSVRKRIFKNDFNDDDYDDHPSNENQVKFSSVETFDIEIPNSELTRLGTIWDGVDKNSRMRLSRFLYSNVMVDENQIVSQDQEYSIVHSLRSL